MCQIIKTRVLLNFIESFWKSVPDRKVFEFDDFEYRIRLLRIQNAGHEMVTCYKIFLCPELLRLVYLFFFFFNTVSADSSMKDLISNVNSLKGLRETNSVYGFTFLKTISYMLVRVEKQAILDWFSYRKNN